MRRPGAGGGRRAGGRRTQSRSDAGSADHHFDDIEYYFDDHPDHDVHDGAPMSLERRPWWRRSLRRSGRLMLTVALCLPVFAGATALAGSGLLLFGDLPGTVPDERERLESIPSFVYDAHGNRIGEFREFELTVAITPEQVPEVLKGAVVAAEDQNFWEHEGFDVEGLARAAWTNYRQGDTLQGGSTITQQLIRELYLSREQTVERKLNEIILATRYERDLAEELGSVEAAKEQILFDYLDTVYFGAGAYGIGAAAETFFRKPVSELTLSEAATLAGIIPAPSDVNPRADIFAAEERRRLVLKNMLDLEMVTQAEFDEAFGQILWWSPAGDPPGPATLIHPAPSTSLGPYPYFVDYVRTYLTDRYGPEIIYRGGLQIHTTIDPDLQAMAEEAVSDMLAGTEWPLEMSLVSVEPSSGHVRAFVAGRDFEQSQVNLALGGSTGMQPGSVFKVFTAAKALEDGMGPETAYDSPGTLYVPGCGGQCAIRGGPGGDVTMEAAMAASTNTYFAQLIMDVGPNNVAELAHRVGVTRTPPDRDYNLGLTLGVNEVSPLDMAAGFSVFANQGVRADATPINWIDQMDGTTLEDNRGPRGEPVLHPAVADNLTAMLTGVVESGTGRSADIGRPAAGKTGTAERNQAAWFVGYTPQLSTAVWMGFADEPRPLRGIKGSGQVFGGGFPAQTWARFMRAAHEGLDVIEFREAGPLPAPSSEVRRIPRRASVPSLPRDCGGPCVQVPEPPPPPTLPPPPEPPAPPEADAPPPDPAPPDDAPAPTTTVPATVVPTPTVPPAVSPPGGTPGGGER
ncbi:MAG: transglycosylase domain-containing protein [Acidimicrobiia bacterium]|nr:transglycosylase domain-containing protein [Acidimicrobiia bacterium]